MTEKHFFHLPVIIQGCKERKKKCQELLYKEFYGYVMSIALRYVARRDLAEEILNDCFYKVFDHIDEYNTMKPFKTWMRKIAVNTCIDQLRKENKFVSIGEFQLPQDYYNETTTAAMNYESILKGLDHLPILQRLVFNMYEIEGYSHSDISVKLEIRESSSRTYLARAKKKLRKYYQQLIRERNVGF